jgi:hypothetical protein
MDILMIRNLGEDQQVLGKGLGVEEEQQGCPQQEGDQVRLGWRLHLGFQDQYALKWTPKMHPNYDCDGLDMVGKIKRLSNQPNWFLLKIHPESTGIFETIQRSDSVLVLQHRLLGRWAVYRVGAH